jgi:DNA repair photolyase
MKDKYRVIYTPRGRAREYGELAVNLYNGCSNCCKYCFGPQTLHKTPKEFHYGDSTRPFIIDKLEMDLAEMRAAGDTRRVLMCFVCDPYQSNSYNIITSRAVELFGTYGRNFQILTKGGMHPAVDFGAYKPGDLFAATLTFMDGKLSEQWEPKAASPQMRVEGLFEAAKRGIQTWVSFEPVIVPEQTLALYLAVREFVPEFRIGKLNYMAPPEPIDHEAFVLEMIERCVRDNKKLYIKESLREYVPEYMRNDFCGGV